MTADTRARFLATLAETGRVTDAAMAAGVARQTVYSLKESDLQFADAWTEALEQYRDRIRAAVAERGLFGAEEVKEVYDERGALVRVERSRRASDRMLLAEARRVLPEEFGERATVDVTHRHSGAVTLDVPLSDFRQAVGYLAEADPTVRRMLEAAPASDEAGVIESFACRFSPDRAPNQQD